MRFALAAFEPFDGRRVNRSAQVLARVRPPEGLVLDKRILPVDFGKLPGAVAALLDGGPDAVLLMGESRQAVVSVERIALNVIDARVPDNSGAKPRRVSLVPDAPLALASSWDAEAVVEAIRRAGVRVAISHHAGTYACNAALYLALAAGRSPTGFIHVPARPWPIGPSLDRLARGVEAALAAMRDSAQARRSMVSSRNGGSMGLGT